MHKPGTQGTRETVAPGIYEAVTQGIRVRVTPQFLEEESSPHEDRYVWAYTVDIRNEGSETVQLRWRHWRITDASGRTEEVRGRGVVGQTPVVEPGGTFSYTSSCPLPTPSGIMVGSYQMITGSGESIEVAVPAFSLDSPHSKPRFN
jgi:ApaG protein